MDSHRASGGSHWGDFLRADPGGAAGLAETGAGAMPGGLVKRRLSDRIEQAFDQACDQGQVEVAACMLKGLDLALLGRPTPWERRQAALVLLRTCANRLEALRDTQAAASPETALAITAA